MNFSFYRQRIGGHFINNAVIGHYGQTLINLYFEFHIRKSVFIPYKVIPNQAF